MIIPYENHTFIVHLTNQHTPLLIIVIIINMVKLDQHGGNKY
jgi:hypothetical protein